MGWNRESIKTYDTIKLKVTDTLLINTTFSGLSGVEINLVKVYPNPTSTELIIDFNDYNSILGYKVEIFDVSGKLVYNSNVSSQILNVDLSTWTGKGIYFITITDKIGKHKETKKIILE